LLIRAPDRKLFSSILAACAQCGHTNTDMNALTRTEIRALNEALNDEYRGWATYDQMIADFGEATPLGALQKLTRSI
jgi:hypothetical protein